MLASARLELSNAIQSALDGRDVPYLSFQHPHQARRWRLEKDAGPEPVARPSARSPRAAHLGAAVSDCYHALGIVHVLHEPVVDRFKDYIEQPKPNGYPGLVQGSRSHVFETDRSLAMHRLAEHGEASHTT